MRAWLEDPLITVEGTIEEWRLLIPRIVGSYHEYNSIESVLNDLVDFFKEKAAKGKRPAVSTRAPDLEWYDGHQK
jgi:hypothetical protein